MPTSPDPDVRAALSARSAGVVRCGEMTLARIGFGAAKLTGPGIWGPPADPDAAVAVLRRAVSLGVNLIDTADAYGPHVSEELVRRALHPYREVFVATKGGCLHPGPDRWAALGDPLYLRQSCELSLRRLDVEAIDLYQLHEVDRRLPFTEQLGALIELRDEGKIRNIGLSAVTPAQLETACAMTEIASVQGELNLLVRDGDPVRRECARRGIAFVPFFPLADGRLARPDGPLARLADAVGCLPAQLAIAWLLARSPNVVPIPGTSRAPELEQNVAAAAVRLDEAVLAELERCP